MRRVLPLVILMSFAGVARGGAAEHVDSKSAAIKFGGVTAKPVKLTMGDKIKLDAELKFGEVGKQTAVSVHGDVQNTTDQKIYYSYQIAFLDKEKNLVGCSNFTLWLDPGKKGGAASFISLSPAQIEKIAFYAAVFYEDADPIGTR
jgi:hypothetical protein